jgi:hypothetical protein
MFAVKKRDGGCCNGGLMDNAFKYAQQADICTEDSCAYQGKGGSCAASGCCVGLKTGEVTGFVDVDVNSFLCDGCRCTAIREEAGVAFHAWFLDGGWSLRAAPCFVPCVCS